MKLLPSNELTLQVFVVESPYLLRVQHNSRLRCVVVIRHVENRIGQPPLEAFVVAELLEQFGVVLHVCVSGLVVLPDVAVSSVEQLLVLVQVVLQKRFAECPLHLAFPR